jgi:RimJ/RimL family protein N-acetyltransferase
LAYNNKIQADEELFRILRAIPVNENILLRLIFKSYIDLEAIKYYDISSQPIIKRYIPYAYVSNLEEAKEKVFEFRTRTEVGGGLFYFISDLKSRIPLGCLNLASPLTETGLNCWTVDFWIHPQHQGFGIVNQSLSSALKYLKSNSVSIVRALVCKENYKSINVLDNTGFLRETETDINYIYKIEL